MLLFKDIQAIGAALLAVDIGDDGTLGYFQWPRGGACQLDGAAIGIFAKTASAVSDAAPAAQEQRTATGATQFGEGRNAMRHAERREEFRCFLGGKNIVVIHKKITLHEISSMQRLTSVIFRNLYR